ncbi:MAG: hypothetical protein LQ340_002713 [Diploschistes diacapsis]|nr:MAG: hypothetical protein LQ340_002713 [Diploschistes diacapsis]
MAEAGAVIPPLEARPIKNTICLFDVDETLTPARRHASPEMLSLLSALRRKVAIGYVGGSDFRKQEEQLGTASQPVASQFDFCFAENGLTAFRMGAPLAGSSFIEWLGEARYKELVNWILVYVARLDIPIKRGTFVEFRNGMINVSPVGRNASQEERDAFQRYDAAHGVRREMVRRLESAFPDLGLKFSIGGQISFDVFPHGWDKTYCLRHVEAEKDRTGVVFSTIHFFGDKAYEGGNDWEIYSDSRTVGHKVDGPADTMAQLREMFDL